MIGELELELAIGETSAASGLGEAAAYYAAAIDIRPVSAYARRMGQVQETKGASGKDAGAAGFMLGFRLGVLAARHESRMREQ